MRNIGNVDAHLPQSVLKLLYRQSVVEVLGIFRVDGACECVAEVLALGIVLGSDFGRNLLGSLLHILGIFIRQTVLCENSVHLDIVVARFTQYVNHLANHIAVVLVGPFHNLHHSIVAVLAALQLASRNYDAVGKHVAWRDKSAKVVVDGESSHEGVLGSFQNLNHLRLVDVVLASCHARIAHVVARQSPH